MDVGIGAIVGGGIGATPGGRGGTMSIELSQIGICLHCPPVQSQFQVQLAEAIPAASNSAKPADKLDTEFMARSFASGSASIARESRIGRSPSSSPQRNKLYRTGERRDK